MVALFFATDASEMHLGRFKTATDNVGRKGHTFQPGVWEGKMPRGDYFLPATNTCDWMGGVAGG